MEIVLVVVHLDGKYAGTMPGVGRRHRRAVVCG
jgi:hypothetical protein